ncbi:restriction endonuclease subunit S [Azotobacter beijerinckii]|uniref:Type I restriction enzyme, S subunit n=1 Tax=Azotobacter beijerinckii TaxID=170623 RepID=A0A1I1CEH6_9GAMM|nr:restriction endonuclease subunit S [Azotobacter beijerinckii]SFB60974.1 type I restriction enzyme, S subunit [Azotobacter beijerinckii]
MSFDLPALPEGWEYKTLASCALKDSISYGVVQPGQAQTAGVPIVRVNNFRDGRIDLSDLMQIQPEIEAKYGRTRLVGGEVLLTLVGSVGQVAIASKKLAGFNVARAVGVIHPAPEIGPEWIALCLRSPLSQRLLNSRANTTVQTTINLKELRDLPLPLPPQEVRKDIIELIFSLDDRITLLRETNATLEAIAQALFKSWFVDFDPVRAKAEGRHPEGMDAATAALFPDSFEESELGLVPRGWMWSDLEEIATVIMGLSPNGDSYNAEGEGVPLINGPVEFGEYFPVQTKWTNSASRLSKAGDLIFCVRGSTTGRRVVSDGEYCIGRGVCVVRSRNGSPSFIYQTINFGLHRLLAKTTGSVFPSLSAPDIKGFQVLKSSTDAMVAYERITEPLLQQVQNNHRKAQTLTHLSDTLLPRLISGQLRVPEAEALVEEAVGA